MQDELALVREDLRTLRQQRRGEAAKPQQNDRLFDTLDEDIHQLAAKEKLLMEMHAKHTLQVSSLSSQPVSQWLRA